MKTSSLPLRRIALATLALSPCLMADEPAPQAVAPQVDIKIAVCGGMIGGDTAPSGLLKELKEMEANDESIQSIVKDEKTKTAVEKLNAPIVLKSMEDALQHLTRESMEKIADVVDFEKEQVVIYAWQGSGQDRLRGMQSSPSSATLMYTAGQTEDLKTHCAIYTMPKDCKVNVVRLEQHIIRCGVGQLQGGPNQGGAIPIPLPRIQLEKKQVEEAK